MSKAASRDTRLKTLQQYRDKQRQKYGSESVALGNERYHQDVVPSPSWMLDYKTGIGGFPYRHMVEVYGANSLGKSTVLGYNTIANVQKQGRLPALIAAEPAFDENWAARFFDPELCLIKRPDNIEQLFEMLHDLVYDDLIDYVVVDSLGGMGTSSETDGKGKKAFGISGVTTSGLNAIMPRMWKNNIGLMIINQQRQDTKTRTQPGMGMSYDSPGGEALHHHAVMRIQLKPGRTRYTVPMGTGKDRENDVLVGRELVCTFKKNKLAMNSKAARFDFFYIPTEKYGFGLDRWEDIVRTCKAVGVIKGSASWLEHEAFPKGKVNGKAGLAKVIEADPAIEARLRQEVLAKMLSEQIELRKQADAGAAVDEREEPEEAGDE